VNCDRSRATLTASGFTGAISSSPSFHRSWIAGGSRWRLVAAVHDTSADMVERHYGAFIVDASEDLLRRAVVPMASVGVAGSQISYQLTGIC
jgi:hypothetical protein